MLRKLRARLFSRNRPAKILPLLPAAKVDSMRIAIEETIKIWQYLEDHNLVSKVDHPNFIEIRSYNSSCPLCHYFVTHVNMYFKCAGFSAGPTHPCPLAAYSLNGVPCSSICSSYSKAIRFANPDGVREVVATLKRAYKSMYDQDYSPYEKATLKWISL